MKPIQILKALEKLYEKRESIDKEIAEMASKLTPGKEKAVKPAKIKPAKKLTEKKSKANKASVKKPRGRKAKTEAPAD